MLQLLKQLRVLLTPQDKWKLLGIVALMTLSGAAEIAGVGLLMPVIAVFTKPELMEQNVLLRTYARIAGGGSTGRLLIVSCLLVIIVFLLKNLLALLVIFLQAKFSTRKEYETSMRLFEVYMRAPYELHLKHGHVELGVMIVRAREACFQVLLPLMVVASDVLVIAMLSCALLYSMPLVTLVTVFSLGINVFLACFLLRKINYRVGREYTESRMEAECTSGDGLRAIREVKVNGSEDYFINRSDAARKRVAFYYMLLYTAGQIPRLWLETAAVIQLLLIFCGMILLGVPHGTVLLTFSLLIAAMSRMLPACSRINYNLTVIRQSLAAFQTVFETLFTPREKVAGETELEFKNRITVEDLSFSYVPGRPVLEHFDLTIPRLASVAFTGTTGSGKSTLADLILGLLEPQKGAVKCDGRDIRTNLASWRSKIGYVPQFIFLLNSTIRANVAFGVPEEEIDDRKVMACLRIAQLEDFVGSLPEKLDSSVGDNGIQLSGGQRQRIGIARALYRDPEILLLDEATSALDNETEEAFVKALKLLHGKLTVLMIAHRLTTVAHCDLHVDLSGKKGASVS